MYLDTDKTHSCGEVLQAQWSKSVKKISGLQEIFIAIFISEILQREALS